MIPSLILLGLSFLDTFAIEPLHYTLQLPKQIHVGCKDVSIVIMKHVKLKFILLVARDINRSQLLKNILIFQLSEDLFLGIVKIQSKSSSSALNLFEGSLE